MVMIALISIRLLKRRYLDLSYSLRSLRISENSASKYFLNAEPAEKSFKNLAEALHLTVVFLGRQLRLRLILESNNASIHRRR